MQVFALVLMVASSFGGGSGSVNDNQVDGWVATQPLKLARQYHMKGVLHLPYAELEEPIEAWVDQDNQKSRLDYYGGTQKVYQYGSEGEYGTQREVIPVTKSRKQSNVRTCIRIKGSATNVIRAQAMIPDEEGFNMVGREICMGQVCEKWQLIEKKYTRTNTYTLYVKWQNGKATPIKYHMQGYNGLFDSHYDHYQLIYSEFEEIAIDSAVFEIDHELHCPGTKNEQKKLLHAHNPMKEFINRDETHVDDAFEAFKTTHSKNYNENEHELRRHNFKRNLRFINSKNREGLSYKLAINHLADLSPEEMKVMRGRKHSPTNNAAAETGIFTYTPDDVKDLPENWDWRIPGAVTQVKDQATCGSCWAFGAVGAIEGSYFVKNGQRLVLSEQALVDCSWGEGSNGCDGGLDIAGYNLIMKAGGLPTEDEYGQYLGIDGYCHIWNATKAVEVAGYKMVKSGDEDGLMVALYNNGPISIAIDANPLAMSFYSSGVFYDPTCKSGEFEVNHAVLLVGYGTLNKTPYWLIKNSWSTHWGNDGYILISRDDDNCGVATSATFPLLNG